jgi:hypothetical protein
MKTKISYLDKYIEPVINFLNKIPCDKYQHFTIGVILFFIFSFISPIFSLILVLIIAGLKELYDKYHKNHTCDIYDFIATSLGGITGFILSI